MSRMMIMAGGTGGHVMPALAVASVLLRENIEISWIGTRDGLEATLVPEANIDFDEIDIKGLRRSGIVRKLLMPFMLLKAMIQTLAVIRSRNPDAVLGMGGFVSAPGGLVAALIRLPVILHEQNSVAGLTNRLLCRISHTVMSGFPVATGLKNFQWTGNPVRASISRIPEPALRLGNRSGDLRVLVIGGSGGARVFNQELPELLGRHARHGIEVWHQCGQHGGAQIEEDYRQHGIKFRVEKFIREMDEAYEWSDLVICRSGAMTVSEVCCAGAVAIFVPYPYAVNDHQAANAHYLVDENAAFIVNQEKLRVGSWLDILEQVRGNRELLVSMGNAARALARPQASETVAKICMEAMNA